ncbi:hypothetical protein FRC08_014568 [Ceratobasidium sp. 394]|nr:hypothetical protein FRC08_014568 [Ceratobasidium sp. 394]
MDLPNPGSEASASSSKDSQQPTREATDPRIRANLQYRETCAIHTLLSVLLSRYRSGDNSPNSLEKSVNTETRSSPATLRDPGPGGSDFDNNDLLKVCLQAAVGLCNEGQLRKMVRAQ